MECKECLKRKIIDSIKVEGECWIWQKASNRSKNQIGGYEITNRKGKNILAHRLSYEVFKDPIPTGMCVLHTCDNRKCVNPDHLWIGTYKDNAIDAFKKGRLTKVWGRKKTQEEKDKIQKNRSIPYQKGEKSSRAKLKTEQVLEIRKMLKDKVKYKVIASLFEIDICSIADIKFRRTWKHI